MQVRTIPKNYGTHISSPLGRATNNKDIVLKSQGQNWIQYHSLNKLQDVISLPSSLSPQLRMAKLDLCVDGTLTKSGKTQYVLSSWNNVYVGNGNRGDMQLSINKFQLSSGILYTNCVCVNSSKYCNIGLNYNNESELNIFQINYNSQSLSTKRQLSYQISNSTNLAFNHNSDSLFYLSHNYSTNQMGSQYMVCLNMQYHQVQSCIKLPDVDMQGHSKLLTIGNSRTGCLSELDRQLCVYGRDWLAIADTRMQGLALKDDLHDCECIFTNSGDESADGSKFTIMIAQNNQIYEYDIRKAIRNRKPVLQHQNQITNAHGLYGNIGYVQDVYSCNIHLYALNSQSPY